MMNSPYYYLQPNDIVYVAPLNTKKEQASLTRANISIFLAAVSTAALVILTLR
jgi:polysaccharide export outer membrane protein